MKRYGQKWAEMVGEFMTDKRYVGRIYQAKKRAGRIIGETEIGNHRLKVG